MAEFHQTKVRCDLFNGEVHVCFVSSGDPKNLELRVTEAWLEAVEDKTVVTLNAALDTAREKRRQIIELPKATFPLIRLGAWDDLLDRAQRDREEPAFMEAAE